MVNYVLVVLRGLNSQEVLEGWRALQSGPVRVCLDPDPRPTRHPQFSVLRFLLAIVFLLLSTGFVRSM